MPDKQKLFTDFEGVSYEKWLRKVEKDLKGKALDALDADFDGIVLSPFHHADTLTAPTSNIKRSKKNNEWLIDSHFDSSLAARSLNASILHQLQNGVQAITLTKVDAHLDFDALLAGIQADYISIDFHLKEEVEVIAFAKKYAEFSKNKGINTSALKGNLKFALDSLTVEDLQELALILPAYRFLYFSSTQQGIAALSDALLQATHFLDRQDLSSTIANDILGKVVFEIAIGKHYFGEIARLRALRILWANILKAYELHFKIEPFVKVIFDKTAYSPDPNHNLIAATTMTLSAAIGLADQIWVRPGDDLDASQTTTSQRYTRMSRNTQHILKMESFIDRVLDPAAGSYYIETLTREIVERVWSEISKG